MFPCAFSVILSILSSTEHDTFHQHSFVCCLYNMIRLYFPKLEIYGHWILTCVSFAVQYINIYWADNALHCVVLYCKLMYWACASPSCLFQPLEHSFGLKKVLFKRSIFSSTNLFSYFSQLLTFWWLFATGAADLQDWQILCFLFIVDVQEWVCGCF